MKRPIRAGGVALAAAAGLSVGGCFGTPDYGPVGFNGSPYGYTDVTIQGGHSIRVTLPGSTKDPQLAYAYWNRRAEEICEGAILRRQIHTAQQQVWDYDRVNGVIGDYVLEGYVWCAAPAGAEPALAAPAPAAS